MEGAGRSRCKREGRILEEMWSGVEGHEEWDEEVEMGIWISTKEEEGF